MRRIWSSKDAGPIAVPPAERSGSYDNEAKIFGINFPEPMFGPLRKKLARNPPSERTGSGGPAGWVDLESHVVSNVCSW